MPPYSFRHTFVSVLKNDLPEQFLKAYLGHGASMDTYGVYAHAIQSDIEESRKIIVIALQKNKTFVPKFVPNEKQNPESPGASG